MRHNAWPLLSLLSLHLLARSALLVKSVLAMRGVWLSMYQSSHTSLCNWHSGDHNILCSKSVCLRRHPAQALVLLFTEVRDQPTFLSLLPQLHSLSMVVNDEAALAQCLGLRQLEPRSGLSGLLAAFLVYGRAV